MPWETPSIDTVRSNNRDYIVGKLQKPLIPNDYPRVLADANAGNAHLNLQYLDWQAGQYLPDTAEKTFLDRHANIWLVNADGSRGRKVATYAKGLASFTGVVAGAVVPQASQVTAIFGAGSLTFETTAEITVGVGTNTLSLRALDPGAVGNLPAGTALSLAVAVPGLDVSSIVVVLLTGGADEENDDDLRARVLQRIQKPPMGGDADDYEAWALAVPGVTRAWCSPKEMGLGSVTVRVMCDSLRAANGGFPTADDLQAVSDYLALMRPVCADVFVVSPIAEPISFGLSNLSGDSVSLRAAIAVNVQGMLRRKAMPAHQVNGGGQPATTIYAAWVSEAVSATPGVTYFDLAMADVPPVSRGSLGVLGAIS